MIKTIANRFDPTLSGIVTLAAASLAALGLAYIVPGGAAAPASTGSISPGVERPVIVWQIVDDMSGATCEARPGPRISNGTHPVELSEGCPAVLPALADAVTWKVDLEGAVSMTDARGRLIIAFGTADGRQMEAIEPGNVMVSLRRL